MAVNRNFVILMVSALISILSGVKQLLTEGEKING